jgi:hypothetical protein
MKAWIKWAEELDEKIAPGSFNQLPAVAEINEPN